MSKSTSRTLYNLSYGAEGDEEVYVLEDGRPLKLEQVVERLNGYESALEEIESTIHAAKNQN